MEAREVKAAMAVGEGEALVEAWGALAVMAGLSL
jgi:hypothetical protein